VFIFSAVRLSCSRTSNPKVAGSSPAGRVSQPPENKTVTETDKPSTESPKQKLAPSLFSNLEIDPDLRLIIDRWQTLSVELRQAIVKMVR